MIGSSSGRRGVGLRIEEFTSRDNRPGWCAASPVELHGDLTEWSKNKPFIVRHWSTFARLLSLALVIVIWTLIFLILDKEDRSIGYYMTFAATVVTFFEMTFVLHKVFCGLERKDTRLHKTWDFILNINTWKKLILYVLLSIPAFLKPSKSPLTLGCGILMNLIGILDFIHLFRDKNTRAPIRYRQLGVL